MRAIVIMTIICSTATSAMAPTRKPNHQIKLDALDLSPDTHKIRKWSVDLAAKKYGINKALINAVIHAESRGNHALTSSKGAVGIMQIMPITAIHMKIQDPTNITQNIMGGTKYLAWLRRKYDGDLDLMLAAYNAGPSNVDRYGGVPPFEETEQYIIKVLKYYQDNP